jgi:hypothetical protein
MQTKAQTIKIYQKPSWRRILSDALYFGVPILLGISSVILPIRSLLRQAMVGFFILWFTIGGWLINKPG